MYYSDFNNRPENRQEEAWQQPYETTAYRVESVPETKKKKGRMWPKITALCLSCALVGGLVGGGVASLTGLAGGAGSTTLYEGNHAPTIVNVSNVHQSDPLTAAQIYATYVGSTVGITTEINTNIFGQIVPTAASGSGFVISSDGYIVTNYHVIDEADTIKVTFSDGKSYDAVLVGGEEENDLAVLKIDAAGLTPVRLGNSDNLVVGEQVVAIGNPLGELTYSMSQGIVSALNRNITMSDGTRMNYIQTDAAINSGNSGGPLFNMYGEVIGIVSAKLSGSSGSSASIEGLGFAIPLNDVGSMIQDIIEHGYVTGKPYMGVIVSSVSGEAQRYGTPAGAYIMGVVQGSCSDLAGLEQGDIITGIDDTAIASSDDLINANKDYKAGDTAKLTVIRGGEQKTLTITFDEETVERNQATQALHDEIQQQQQKQYQQQNGYGNYYWPFGW